MLMDGAFFQTAQDVAAELLRRAGPLRDGRMVLILYGRSDGGYTQDWYLTEADGTIRLTDTMDKTERTIQQLEDLFHLSVENGRDEYRDIRLLIDQGTLSVDIVWNSDMPDHMRFFYEEFDNESMTPEERDARRRDRYIAYSELYFGDARLVWHVTGSAFANQGRGDVRTGEDLPYPDDESPWQE
jgi:hypothetical protein